MFGGYRRGGTDGTAAVPQSRTSSRRPTTSAAAMSDKTKASNDVFVLGVGMTKFEKPGRRADFDYPEMAAEAVTKALTDAGVEYTAVEQAYVGYVYGDSTCGQRALYPVGMTGIPIINVNNNCATGSSALYLAFQAIRGGQTHCALALGFEKMQRGSLSSQFSDRTNPMDRHVEMMCEVTDMEAGPITAQMFGNAGREHMAKYGTTEQHFAKIAWKNHKHSVDNPYSQFRDEYSLEQILSAPTVHAPLTKLQCCPTSDGGAAAILVSRHFLERCAGAVARARAVRVLGVQMTTDPPSSLSEKSCMKMVGYDMTRLAAQRLFDQAGLTPADVQVVELHDCFSANELITYEALGLCPEGHAGRMIDDGDNTYGGKYVVNPSGGLISKGHPLGATGLAQCAELCWQVRGEAEKRQVAGARVGLQHNIGLGGAAVVALYKMETEQPVKSSGVVTAHKDGAGLKSTPYFEKLQKLIEQEGKAIVDKIGGIIEFRVSPPPGHNAARWTVDLKSDEPGVYANSQRRAGLTLELSDADLTRLFAGELSPEQAYRQQKMRYMGDTGLAFKLRNLVETLHGYRAKL
ncbi:sterol carrier protein 2-like isoform X2 [Amphibalanus amphitrite]|uniref:sterol carrier protein 2-like isoform X2 n=2 Tax=Amphibalanus amphitrite TaxID=1232801 RepID=UPI001C8FA76B|nr:sterol carrier protein 2-like isoform X2 [Amphibalanus amphitrite]